MDDVLKSVLEDLAAEGDRLDKLVSGLEDAVWRWPTPAPGWDIATQIAHLAWTDEAALAAATDKAAWDELVLAALADPEGFVDAQAFAGAAAGPAAVLDRWRSGRVALVSALKAYPEGQKMPWYGPPMSATSMATARFMETWAHSLDVHSTLGVEVVDTDAIRHIAHLGVRTRDFAFTVHGEKPPVGEFRIDLISPSEDVWAWGPGEAAQTVTGTASDFCRLVTQRINRADTDLVASGPDASRWLDIAQCFAGPAGSGRAAL